MHVINIRNVPTDIHRKAKKAAISDGLTLKDYVFQLIEKDVAIKEKRLVKAILKSS